MYEHDIGSQLKALHALNIGSSADYTTASTAAFGPTIDRLAYGNFQSAKACVSLTGIFGSSSGYATVGIAFEHSDSSGSTSFVSASTATTPTSVTLGSTASTGAQTDNDQIVQDIDLGDKKRYVRIIGTIDFSATSSADYVRMGGCLVFGGANELPAA